MQNLKAILDALQSHCSPPKESADRINYDDFCVVRDMVKDISSIALPYFTASVFLKVCEIGRSAAPILACVCFVSALVTLLPASTNLLQSVVLLHDNCCMTSLCVAALQRSWRYYKPHVFMRAAVSRQPRDCVALTWLFVRKPSSFRGLQLRQYAFGPYRTQVLLISNVSLFVSPFLVALRCAATQFPRDEHDRISIRFLFQYICGSVGLRQTRIRLRHVSIVSYKHLALCLPYHMCS